VRASLFTDTAVAITRSLSARTDCDPAAQITEVGSEMAACALLSEAAVMYIVPVVAINAAATRGVHLVSRARMTRHTRELFVRTIDYEPRFLMMIEVPDAPVTCVVTNVAGRSQSSFVRIVLAMTTHTCARCVLEPPGLVTILARYFQMTAEQCEARLRVIEARSLPARFAVTVFTTSSLLSGVNIILAMARHTVRLQLFPERPVRVTAFALHLLMTAKQRITGLSGVVEPGRLPVRFQVTGLTAGAERAAMDIVPGVTTVTRGWRLFLMPRIRMAGIALDTLVSFTQFEFRISIMIEDHFLPTRFRMAVLAVRAQSAFVNVVLAVTSNAGCRQFLRVQRCLVARSALDGAMGLPQREVRVTFMVKAHNCPF